NHRRNHCRHTAAPAAAGGSRPGEPARTSGNGPPVTSRPNGRLLPDRRSPATAIRFAVGSPQGPRSQSWVVRRRGEQGTGRPGLFVGPAQAARPPAGTRHPGITIPRGDIVSAVAVDPECSRLTEQEFSPVRGGVEVVQGWAVAAVIVIPPIALTGPTPLLRTAGTTYFPPARPGRIFQATITYGGSDAEPLSIAPGNDGGTLTLQDAVTVQVWINHVPHRPWIDELIDGAREQLARERTEAPATPRFVHTTTNQGGLPVLIDLG
ncbi:MAG: hypothetical protein L0I76_37100, partial [Pseudonocardia sp.]|nr:hypothetical protein [Pseudonocardia sp.]